MSRVTRCLLALALVVGGVGVLVDAVNALSPPDLVLSGARCPPVVCVTQPEWVCIHPNFAPIEDACDPRSPGCEWPE